MRLLTKFSLLLLLLLLLQGRALWYPLLSLATSNGSSEPSR
jgi:hypothetical protein